MLCNHHFYVPSKHFHCSKAKSFTYYALSPHYPLSSLFSSQFMFCVYGINYSEYFMSMESYNLWCFVLASFAKHNILEIHPCYSIYHYFITFYDKIIFHYKCILQHFYPFVCWWTSLGCCESCGMSTFIHVHVWVLIFIFFWSVSRSEILWSYSSLIFVCLFVILGTVAQWPDA